MGKILILHQGALGDLILSLPAIYALRDYPEATTIHLVSRTDLAGIIIGNNFADEVFSHDKGLFASLFSSAGHMPEPLVEFLGGFTAAFVFMRVEDDILMRNIRTYIPDCFIVRSIPPDGIRTHVSVFQLEQIQAVAGNKRQKMPVPGLFSSDCSVCDTGPVIAVHPGSGGKKKCWPLEKYLRLIELLDLQQKYRFKIILGPAESDEAYAGITAFLSEKNIRADIIRERSVAEIASLLKSSSLYIGNDSGISHLASLLGTPVIAIFGPTDHELWKPMGGKVMIVRSDIICSPCPQEVCRNCQAPVCLEKISPETVFGVVKTFVQGPPLKMYA